MSGGPFPFDKVYIDSRLTINVSVSESQFKYELVESLQLPVNAFCFVDVIIPPSYFNVGDTGTLYIRRLDDII